MDLFERGGYIIEYDPVATRKAYGKISNGGADVCTCSSCKNFAAHRPSSFHREFLATLHLLGIDPAKEGEAYECGKDSNGLYLYGGWFHFTGRVTRTGEENEVDSFRYWFDPPGQVPRPDHDAFGDSTVSAIEFMTHLPWIIADEEPEQTDHATRPRGFWRRFGRTIRLLD